jgi:hypothetical protein
MKDLPNFVFGWTPPGLIGTDENRDDAFAVQVWKVQDGEIISNVLSDMRY